VFIASSGFVVEIETTLSGFLIKKEIPLSSYNPGISTFSFVI